MGVTKEHDEPDSSLQSKMNPSHINLNALSTDVSACGPNNYEIPPVQDMVTDFTNVFTTHEHFPSQKTLFDWVCARGKEHGCVVTVGWSNSGEGNKRAELLMTCERSGQYCEDKSVLKPSQERNGDETDERTNGKNAKRKRETETKICWCPFLLKGEQVNERGEWKLDVICGVHNHSTGRYYYTNTSDAIKQNESDGQSQMQQLIQKLEKHSYYHIYRRCEKTGVIKDLFFAHPWNIKLLRAFPYVVLMDCTYKTNRYKRPLLAFVGVTSIQVTFSIAAVYLEFELEDNYTWACTILKSLMDQSHLPYVIVSGREIPLMNAIETTFPTSKHFLCRRHIDRNVAANCKKILKTKENWDAFNLNWKLLVDADTELKFNDMVSKLSQDFNKFPKAVKYVMEQWVTPYKERFVSYWTNNVMHFDNLIATRVNSQHVSLRRQLGSNKGDFETWWWEIHSIIESSHVAMKHLFGKSSIVIRHKFNLNIFRKLQCKVSVNALELLYDEINRLGENGVDPLLCRCVLRKTCGLPCPHELAEFVRLDLPIPLNKIHAFWRKLGISSVKKDVIDVRHGQDSQFKEFWTNPELKCDQAIESARTLVLKRLAEISTPATKTIDEIDGDCNF